MFINRQEFAYSVLTNSEPIRTYPGKYRVFNPKNGSVSYRCYVDSDGKYSFPEECTDKSYSKLSSRIRKECGKLIIIDPENLDPLVVKKILKKMIKRDESTVVFASEFPHDAIFDPVAIYIEECKDEFQFQFDIFEYWPEMPKFLFTMVTGFLHPCYSPEEILNDIKTEMRIAHEKLLLDDFLSAENHSRTAESLLRWVPAENTSPKSWVKLIEEITRLTIKTIDSLNENNILDACDSLSETNYFMSELNRTKN